MKVLQESWVLNLLDIFQKEVHLYKEILAIETAKTTAIIDANGKKIEEYVKKTYELMVTASEIETARMRSIEEIYQKASLDFIKQPVTLTNFLNQIDRDSNFRLKGIAQSLKETVGMLKDKIYANEKLLKARKELFHRTVEAIKSSMDEPVYLTEKEIHSKKRKPVMVNMHA